MLPRKIGMLMGTVVYISVSGLDQVVNFAISSYVTVEKL